MNQGYRELLIKSIAAFVMGSGITALSAYCTGITYLASWKPGTTPMALSTSIVITTIGVALWALTRKS